MTPDLSKFIDWIEHEPKATPETHFVWSDLQGAWVLLRNYGEMQQCRELGARTRVVYGGAA